MSAVQARVHYAMKQEFKLLRDIIRDYTPTKYEYTPSSGTKKAKKEDYDMVEVIPVSDPNSSTMAQRIMQYQAAMQMAQQAPQIYNLPNLHRQMLEVLGIKNADKLVPTDDDQKPRDPISENMAFLKGKPTKAFIYQDHDAHITVHNSMMKDPTIAAQIGQSPMGQQMTSAIMAHISEHLAFQYRAKIEKQMGIQMPAPDKDMPEDVEVQLSSLVAVAAQAVLQQGQTKAAQQQAAQQAQDPLVQMQQAQLQIAQQEAATKAQKVQGDLQIKQAELQLKAQAAQAKNPQADLAAKQQIIQQQLQAKQQEIQQNAQAHQQELIQNSQIHQQNMAQSAEDARLKAHLEMMRLMNKPKGK
jgi:hypothetical protein